MLTRKTIEKLSSKNHHEVKLIFYLFIYLINFYFYQFNDEFILLFQQKNF